MIQAEICKEFRKGMTIEHLSKLIFYEIKVANKKANIKSARSFVEDAIYREMMKGVK